MGLPEAQLDKAIQVAKDGNDLLLEARQRIAELKAENMRVGLHNCWLEEQVEYGGGVIGMREQRIAELEDERDNCTEAVRRLMDEEARLREELAGCITWHVIGGLPEDTDYELLETRLTELEAKQCD